MSKFSTSAMALSFGVALLSALACARSLAQPAPPSPDDVQRTALIQEMHAYKARCSTVEKSDSDKYNSCLNQKHSLEERAKELGVPDTELRHWVYHP